MVNKLFKMSENVVKSCILHSEYWGKGRSLSRDCSRSHNVLKSDISDSRADKNILINLSGVSTSHER